MLSWPDLELKPINLWNCPAQFWKEQMALTHNDIKDKLAVLPETVILELLDISTEELIDRFEDKIEERRDYFEKDLE